MAKRPRCFLVMRSTKDVSGAEKHGDIVLLFPDNERRPSFWNSDFIELALAKLEQYEYDPGFDYLLMAGNVVPISLVAAAVARESEVGPQFLFFDAAQQGYVAVALPPQEVPHKQ